MNAYEVAQKQQERDNFFMICLASLFAVASLSLFITAAVLDSEDVKHALHYGVACLLVTISTEIARRFLNISTKRYLQRQLQRYPDGIW